MKYEKALKYLEEIGCLGSVPGLESIKELCKRLDNPQDKLHFIHVAGTNGKGSTIAYLSTILKTAQILTGRYTSPAVMDYLERYQVNGKKINQKDFGRILEQVKEVADEMVSDALPRPTVFETETVIAFLYFLEQNCRIVILETGMGGTLDATNLVTNTLLAVITSISMDHMQFLGNSIEKIAENKAGIIKPGCTVVSTNQKHSVLKIVEEKTAECKGKFILADQKEIKLVKCNLQKQVFHYKDKKNLEIQISGVVQPYNAVLAVEAALALNDMGYQITDENIYGGLKHTIWGGRFETIGKSPLFILDGAHNEDAAKKLAQSVQYYFTNKQIVYIMGMLKDKEYEKVAMETCGLASQIITVTPPENNRALSAYELAMAVRESNPQVTVADSLEEAVEMAYLLTDKKSVILAFGSLSFLGKLKKIVLKRNGE